jgi:hypothetical protein
VNRIRVALDRSFAVGDAEQVVGSGQRNRRRSRDRDKRGADIGCIVVAAEPFRAPRVLFGRPGALDSSVDCAGLPVFIHLDPQF